MRPTRARILELLKYDPRTGAFTWRVHRGNRHCKGKIAGCVYTKGGYRLIGIDYKMYRAARLAFFLKTGRWATIDHKNCDTQDDRWSNLREATNSQNNANSRPKKNKRHSKLKGVTFHKGMKKFYARISVDGQRIDLGFFDNDTDAHAAYSNAATKYFGEFARDK
jgi:hypothetical protein